MFNGLGAKNIDLLVNAIVRLLNAVATNYEKKNEDQQWK